jgi:hypothetical protein
MTWAGRMSAVMGVNFTRHGILTGWLPKGFVSPTGTRLVRLRAHDRKNKAVRLSKIIKFLSNRKASGEEIQELIHLDLPEDQVIERMMDAPEFNSFIKTYYSQWLDLTEGSKKGEEGRYSRHVKPYVLQEPCASISYLYQKNLSMINLIHSDFLSREISHLSTQITQPYPRLIL